MAIVIAQIPLTTGRQASTVATPSGTYGFRLVFSNGSEGGWLLDLSTEDGTPLVCGVPLRPKTNLLAQYAYLGVGFGLFIVNASDPDAAPSYDDLGTTTKMYLFTQ